ncbi:MAG: alpha-ketoglutarate-dependent dioxygenase AlkB [Candidatus Binatia bacterium]
MPRLFFLDRVLVPVVVPEAEVRLRASLPLGVPPEEVLARLIEETPWRSEKIAMWGREYVQPRLVAWYGDPGAVYAYSGTRYEPHEWTPLLGDLRRRVEDAAGASFNSVLLNYYRDHRDSMGMHSDEPELGPEPVITSLSLGATRTLVLRHRTVRSVKNVRIPLESGSLIVMRGPTQHRWQHGIAKLARPCGPRVNLTFRKIIR